MHSEEKRKKEKEKERKWDIYILVISFGELLQVGVLGIFLLSLVYVNSNY